MRPYQQDDDYWRVRDFLRSTYRAENAGLLNWLVARFDYWRWHGLDNILEMPPDTLLYLWESPDGEIDAVLHAEGLGEAFFEVRPDWRGEAIENALLDAAEQYLAIPDGQGQRRLIVWAGADDRLRQAVLMQRGYERGDWPEFQRWRSLETPILDAPLAPGYSVRALREVDELPARSWASWRAFHPTEPDDRYEGWEWYRNIQRCPLYRRDLDLVAVTANGTIAAFCTLWFDDVTRSGMLEPVGTVPEHQRKGLGRSLICEGLRRLRWLGARKAYVGSYGPEAHALYEAVGFSEYALSERWVRTV
jgi:mycothiol synthase